MAKKTPNTQIRIFGSISNSTITWVTQPGNFQSPFSSRTHHCLSPTVNHNICNDLHSLSACRVVVVVDDDVDVVDDNCDNNKDISFAPFRLEV